MDFRERESGDSSENPGSSDVEMQSRPTGRLPPLEGRESDIQYSHPNQDLLTPRFISPSKGGVPSRAGDTTISMPVGGGSLPSQSPLALISVPGDHPTSYTMDHSREALPKSSVRPIEMVVYFADKTGISLSIEDGQNAEAGEIFEMVMEEMKFPNEARQAFSLWLISDYLELQLKPNHIPFKLAAYWEELLERYVDISEEDAERDEPVLMFSRNVFYSRGQEKQIRNFDLLHLLYHEAKENVIDGRYPLNKSESDYLAGIQALLYHKSYRSHEHTPKYYADHLPKYYPRHLCKKKSFFSREPGAEDRLSDAHARAYKKFGAAGNPNEAMPIVKKYLELCWKLPFYGCAFFRGQIEQPGKPRLFDLDDNPVYVGVNTDGVFVIDMDDSVFLMGLLFEQLAWNYAEPCNKENKSCLPCIFFQFSDKVSSGERFKKVLQVFSREARLLDALMDSCLKLKLEKKRLGEDTVDGIADEDRDGVIEAFGKTWENFNKLCLTTFDENGKVISSKAKLKNKI